MYRLSFNTADKAESGIFGFVVSVVLSFWLQAEMRSGLKRSGKVLRAKCARSVKLPFDRKQTH